MLSYDDPIQKAINEASDGDTITIFPKSFDEDIDIPETHKDVSIILSWRPRR